MSEEHRRYFNEKAAVWDQILEKNPCSALTGSLKN